MRSELEETLRVEGGRVLATLIRLTGDFGLAEDALQDASITALEKWNLNGLPDNPAAWLTTTARRKALDRIRRETARRTKEQQAMRLLDEPIEPTDGVDDRLRLLFTCCHPALSREAQVALALRTIGGLTTQEIARAFLVPEATMGQRISRAKKKIAMARIPYRVPDEHELPDRLPQVLATIYLAFTTGHHPTAGPLAGRVDLAEEALRLARLLADLMPDVPECGGLLSLLLATHARRDTRLDDQGNVVLLADQDRSRWDRAMIEEAGRLGDDVLQRRAPGPYQIQAAIACLHGIAPSVADTDWKQIVDLYRMLEQIHPTPVVTVNRSVAEAEVFGAEAGLQLLETVLGVENWHLYWSTRASFQRRLGLMELARTSYQAALRCEMNDADRRFLERQLTEIE